MQLEQLDEIVDRRRALAARYAARLSDIPGLGADRRPGVGHDDLPVVLGAVARAFPVSRDDLLARLPGRRDLRRAAGSWPSHLGARIRRAIRTARSR